MSRPTGDDRAMWSGAAGASPQPPFVPIAPTPLERVVPTTRFPGQPRSASPATASPATPTSAADSSGFGTPTFHGPAAHGPATGPSVRRRPPDAELPESLDPSGGRSRRSTLDTTSASAFTPAQTYPPGARAAARASRRERGLPAWGAVLVLLVICGIGGLIDLVSGSTVRGSFNVAIVIAALVAILLVRRSAMFAVVIAPPLVYLVASGAMLFVRGGLHNRQALYDEATNWLVYGFPAIAGATAAVLLVAGVRLIINR